MIGPNSSGRIAASIMIAQPAWQLPMTQGLPSASGCSAMTFFKKDRLGARNVFNGLSRHRVRKKAHEVTRVARFERDANFAVGLEAADAWPMAGARINDDEGRAAGIDLDACRRNDTRQDIIDRPFEAFGHRAPAQLHNRERAAPIWRCARDRLIAALAHGVPEQNLPLGRVHGERKGRVHEIERCSVAMITRFGSA